jgi:uncharacterized spore protein YtfJ
MDDDLSRLLAATAKELETILNRKTVVGEPIELAGGTVVPLLSVGFGVGVGGGRGTDTKKGQGGATAMGCGGGVRPVALVISDVNGIRVESIKGGAASAAENIASTIAQVVRAKAADVVSTE